MSRREVDYLPTKIEPRMFTFHVRIDPSKTFYNPIVLLQLSNNRAQRLNLNLQQSKLFPALLVDGVIDGTITIVAAMNLLSFLNITQGVFVNLETVKGRECYYMCHEE